MLKLEGVTGWQQENGLRDSQQRLLCLDNYCKQMLNVSQVRLIK